MIPVGHLISPDAARSLRTVRVHDLSVPGSLSRVSWKLSRTVLRGGTNRNVGPLLDSKQGKQKSPFCFSMADDSIFAFDGIWDRWKNPDKECVETCSIITTSLKQQVRNKLLGAGAAISPPIGAEVQIWFPRFCTKSRNRGSPFSRKQNSNASHSRPLLCATIV